MSEEVFKQMSGKTKAAMLLGFFEIGVSQGIVGRLESFERDILVNEIMRLPKYDAEIIKAVIKEYLQYLKGENVNEVKRGPGFVTELLKEKLPKKELEKLMEKMYKKGGKPFDSLKRIRDVQPLLAFLNEEDPQTIAVIASHMKSSQGAELLESLKPDKRAEVAYCIANMDQTNSDALDKVERFLNSKLDNFVSDNNNSTDGVKILVNILNSVNRPTEKSLLEFLEVKDEDLAKVVKDNMFIFEDITKLDERSLQTVVGKITDPDVIAKALRTASEELKARFNNAMSEKRREIVTDADERLGRIRLADAEIAQQEIANIVKVLEKNNEIIIQRGEEDVIL